MTGSPSPQRLRGWWAPASGGRWLLAILVLATVLRIVWVAYAAREPQGLHDPTLYNIYAQQIADGNGYRQLTIDQLREINPEGLAEAIARGDPLPNGEPTAYYPIGYPAALGVVFALVKHTPIPDNLALAAAYFNVFLGVATVGLVYVVGRRLFSPAVGLLAAAWLAVFPNIVFHTSTFLTETLFMFLVMAALAVLLTGSWEERRLDPWRVGIFGVLLGLSVLVRPISLLFIPALAVVLLVFRFGWRRSLGYSGAALAVTVAVLLPWSIRNLVVMDAPIVLSTNLGDNLCIGNNPSARGHFSFAAYETADYCNFALTAYGDLARDQVEVERNSDNTRTAIEFALENPRFELQLLSRKAWFLWADNDHDGLFAAESYGADRFIDPSLRTALERIADNFFYFTISVGGLALILRFVAAKVDRDRLSLSFRRPEARLLFFVLALLSLAGVPLIFFGDARFHVPVIPLLVVPAAWLVVMTLQAAARLARATTSAGRSGEEVAERRASMTEHDAL